MLRAGRFKHRLLDDEFLKNSSAQAYSCLKVFFQLWREKKLSDQEIAAVYIFVFSFLRRPQDFLGGPHNLFPVGVARKDSFKVGEFLDLLLPLLPQELQKAKVLGRLPREASFLHAFCELSWRSIPASVARSLTAWENKIYPLVLLTHVPSADEVLMMQAQGVRCLSMLTSLGDMQNFVEDGRDVLGFIVHDLIHADHFFADLEKAQTQVLFFQKLRVVRQLPEIQYMLDTDEAFRKEFHYLMSDMNSVPLHLLKALKTVLLGYFKRREQISISATLTDSAEQEFLAFYLKVLQTWSFSQEALLAAQRLNTPLYLGHSDSELLHRTLCIKASDANDFVC